MQGYNVIMVYNITLDKILMCKRAKNPYKGLYNLVGGKIETNESGIESAYRELFEETSISKEHIKLHHMMDFTYHYHNCYIEVYVGKLEKEVSICGDENELFWSTLDHNFFDKTIYAGDGNIGHMIEQVNMCRDRIFNE